MKPITNLGEAHARLWKACNPGEVLSAEAAAEPESHRQLLEGECRDDSLEEYQTLNQHRRTTGDRTVLQ